MDSKEEKEQEEKGTGSPLSAATTVSKVLQDTLFLQRDKFAKDNASAAQTMCRATLDKFKTALVGFCRPDGLTAFDVVVQELMDTELTLVNKRCPRAVLVDYVTEWTTVVQERRVEVVQFDKTMKDTEKEAEKARVKLEMERLKLRMQEDHRAALAAQANAALIHQNDILNQVMLSMKAKEAHAAKEHDAVMKRLQQEVADARKAGNQQLREIADQIQANEVKAASFAAQQRNVMNQAITGHQATANQMQQDMTAQLQALQKRLADMPPPTIVVHHHHSGGCCFAASALVEVQMRGRVPCSEVRPGDVVRAWDTVRGAPTWSRVYCAYVVSHVSRLVRVATREGPCVTLSSDHLVMSGGEFVRAGSLRASDRVLGADGDTLVVAGVTSVSPSRMAVVLTRADTVLVEGVVCSSHDGSHRLGYWENMDLRVLSMVLPAAAMGHWAVQWYAETCDTYIHGAMRWALGYTRMRRALDESVGRLEAEGRAGRT